MWNMVGGSRSSPPLMTGTLTPTISPFSLQYSAFHPQLGTSPLKTLQRQRSFTRWKGRVDTVIRDWLRRKLMSCRGEGVATCLFDTGE